MGRLYCCVRGQRGGIIESNVGVGKCQSHGIRFQGQVFWGRRTNELRSEFRGVYKGSVPLVVATVNIGTSIYQTVREECKNAHCAAHNQRPLTAYITVFRCPVKSSRLGGYVRVQLDPGIGSQGFTGVCTLIR